MTRPASPTTQLLPLLFLLALLGAGGQAQFGASVLTNNINVNNVANFLDTYCGDIASFLPIVCGVGATGPPCCGLFAITDLCRPSCVGSKNQYGPGHQEIRQLMYDPNVCTALRLTGQSQCTGPVGPPQCDRLRCLLNMLCYPYYNFACYYNTERGSELAPILVSSNHNGVSGSANGGLIVGTQGNDKDLGAIIQRNCFELPEVADAEMTGLMDTANSEIKLCPHDLTDPVCKGKMKLRYRTIDGSCNNLQHPRWGKSFEPQKRMLPSQLVNGNLPRSQGVSGPLPNPRSISVAVDPDSHALAGVSNMLMAWGQFIDHDFTGTPVIKNGTKTIKCCGEIHNDLKAENGGPCYPIAIPAGDRMNRDCMEFVRSLAYMLPNGTQQVPREQINTLTSFLDASAVYGNTQEVLDKLKLDNGFLKVTDTNSLPPNPAGGTCKKEVAGDYCLFAGDHRVNVFVGLGGLHTVFVREHNRVAKILQGLNPQWSATVLFEEARRVVSAQLQRVTYVEWLPWVLGPKTMRSYRLSEGDFKYDAAVNPTVANVFSTAAFRFGHSQVKQTVKIGQQSLKLQDTLMRPRYAIHNMAEIMMGLVEAPTNAVDQFFADGLTTHMFETNSTAKDGLDLVTLNIRRGRDHGLPPYNDWRVMCGLPAIKSFKDKALLNDLSVAYSHPDDIDAFVGMVCERHMPNALVGPTLACLLGHQFRDMKFGDRFWYETRDVEERFTADQLQQIQKVSLAKVICDTIPEIKEIQADVMFTSDPVTNPLVPCDKLPEMDLRFWKSL